MTLLLSKSFRPIIKFGRPTFAVVSSPAFFLLPQIIQGFTVLFNFQGCLQYDVEEKPEQETLWHYQNIAT